MSNDVVISKKLMERVIDDLEYLPLDQSAEIIRQLRSLPETVSLEGVERWTQWTDRATKAPDGEWVKLSDLRRLVAPVQPSAVVSREELEALLRSADKGYWTGEMLARELHALLTSRTEGK